MSKHYHPVQCSLSGEQSESSDVTIDIMIAEVHAT